MYRSFPWLGPRQPIPVPRLGSLRAVPSLRQSLTSFVSQVSAHQRRLRAFACLFQKTCLELADPLEPSYHLFAPCQPTQPYVLLSHQAS